MHLGGFLCRDPFADCKVSESIRGNFCCFFFVNKQYLGGFLCRDPFADCKVGDCPVERVRAVQVHPLVVLWAEIDWIKREFVMNSFIHVTSMREEMCFNLNR